MKTLLASLGILSVLVSVSACTVDVKVTPDKRYIGETTSKTAAWTAGKKLTIVSDNGDVLIRTTTGSEVKATFSPYKLAAPDAETAAREKMAAMPNRIDVDGSGNLTVQVDADTDGKLGADLVLEIPAAFDGALVIDADLGDVKFESLGKPASFKILSHGDITGTIAIPEGTGCVAKNACTFTSTLGKIELALSAKDGLRYAVQTQSEMDTATETGSTAAGCKVEGEKSEKAYTILCNQAVAADGVLEFKAFNEVALAF